MSGILGGIPGVTQTQSFTTVPTQNLQLAMYALSIRQPGVSASEYQTYIFPLSPELLRKEYAAMSSFYDQQGQPGLNGVQRKIDNFGLAPPIITIGGTTGWQRHSNDLYLYTGLQAITNLEQLLQTYAQLNAQLVAGGSTILFTLEFYDYFKGEFWQVEPIGPQGVFQNSQKPLLSYYQFRFAAIQQVSMPIIDEIEARLFTAVANTLMRGIQGFTSTVLQKY
jgi:hypothetical protein